MSFRRRMIVLAAGAVAAAVVIASVIVYVVTRDELRGQVDSSLRQKLTPGAPQAIQIQANPPSSAEVREVQRLAGALAGVKTTATVHAQAGTKSRAAGEVLFRTLSAPPGAPAPSASGTVACLLPAASCGGRSPTGAQGGFSARVPQVLPRGNAISAGTSASVQIVVPAGKLGGASGYAQLLRPGGNLLRSAGPGPGLPVTAATRAVAAGRRGAFFSDATVDGTHVRLLTERTPMGGGVWQVALPLSSVDSTLSNLRWLLAGVGVGGILLAAALGLLVSRAALVPVRRLTGAAEQVARTQDLGHRIPAASEPDELGRLAVSFNTMLAALESSRLAQRRLVSDASHELRTPLTSVRANLDALAGGSSLPEGERVRVVEMARAQLAELTVLVDDLVDLSKTGVESAELEDVRLDLAVAGATDRARTRTPGARYVLHGEPCLVRAAPARLDRAITNLLDNACKWGAPSGPIEIAVQAGRVEVRDHGQGIAEQDLPRVFDRFYRAPGARGMPGSGLGLAIVRHFAETHGGSVHAASDPRGGARLTLELPTLAMTAADADPVSEAPAPAPAAGS
jgi:two-component system sensor histidine kinase MprB